jgi:hypothetical protein
MSTPFGRYNALRNRARASTWLASTRTRSSSKHLAGREGALEQDRAAELRLEDRVRAAITKGIGPVTIQRAVAWTAAKRSSAVTTPPLDPLGRTAQLTAADRAQESNRTDRLLNDPLAELLAGEEGAHLLDTMPQEARSSRVATVSLGLQASPKNSSLLLVFALPNRSTVVRAPEKTGSSGRRAIAPAGAQANSAPNGARCPARDLTERRRGSGSGSPSTPGSISPWLRGDIPNGGSHRHRNH